MKSIRPIFASIVLVALASSASAAEVPRPTLSDVFHAMSRSSGGEFTLPAAWAGVWEFTDSDYDCITEEFKNTDVNEDTLCTGQSITEEGPFDLDCTGSAVTDTDIDVACTGTFPVGLPGCNVTITFSLEAHRSGETATVISVFSQDFSPDLCAFQEDSCLRTEGTGSRIAPEPPECATPVEPVTWGRVKASYR